jgi:CRISPR-associated protein Cas1
MRRIVDLSGVDARDDASIFRVRVDKGCLLVAHGFEEKPEETRIPAPEVAVLVLGTRLALSGAVLALVVGSGGCVLSIDDRFRPVGLMTPLVGSTLHAERLRLQIAELSSKASDLWRQIVQQKIRAQADNLRDPTGLRALAERVLPGDPENLEAQAARLYWPELMGGGFTRRDGFDPRNAMLNYGYAVLRAVVARAVCSAGLHPALGIHHDSRRNPFALADDLMEPARAWVDAAVVSIQAKVLDREVKRQILSPLLGDVVLEGERRALPEAYERVAQSLCDVLRGTRSRLSLPL